MSVRVIHCLLLAIICIGISTGCANITAPTGGKKDKTPPKLVSIDPADSLLNTRVKRIEMHFNKYITVSDVFKEVQMSPMLAIQPSVVGLNKRVVVKIVDTLLEDNTTYRLSFGSAIKDVREGNVFKNYTYTFSTGSYFDSMELSGNVINAVTGLPDTGGVSVILYSASEKDSAIVKHKPKYVTKTDAAGNFKFKGLPKRVFRIYALKDANGNLIYDGPADGEMIAFIDSSVTPGDSSHDLVNMRLFSEVLDTASKKAKDSTALKKASIGKPKQSAKSGGLTYTVGVDTSNTEKRTFDITVPLDIVFSSEPALNKEKIALSYDSMGNRYDQPITMLFDTLHPFVLHLTAPWLEDHVYTLRLAKGFAKDTAGKDVMPGRFTFRTKEDDDYGKFTMHLPSKYNDPKYVFLVTCGKDTVYQKPVVDTMITLPRLRPDKYTFRIIVDKNRNGKWDTGDLFGKLQPEEVIPYPENVTLKAGFENIIDFEQKPKPKPEKKDDKTKTK